MIVVDTSAIIAFLQEEPEAARISQRVAEAAECFISAVSVFECRTVLHFRFAADPLRFERFLTGVGFVVVPFDERQGEAAFEAYRRFGKGSGSPARLNLADCAAYALAKTLGMPLLFKGDDFTRTDIASALA